MPDQSQRRGALVRCFPGADICRPPFLAAKAMPGRVGGLELSPALLPNVSLAMDGL
jgi:hypothetical protein